jgi:hypothetical protein
MSRVYDAVSVCSFHSIWYESSQLLSIPDEIWSNSREIRLLRRMKADSDLTNRVSVLSLPGGRLTINLGTVVLYDGAALGVIRIATQHLHQTDGDSGWDARAYTFS